jgi:hypothetical protein
MAVDTGVSISGGSGDEPLIKAKWETPDADPADTNPPTQIDPPLVYEGNVPVEFWVVVADNPITDISMVSVDVYHPAGYPESGSFKFEVVLLPYMDALSDGVILEAEALSAIAAFNAAYDDGLVTLHAGISAQDVRDELSQGEAWLWGGAYEMYYHQPAGDYKVDAFAIDAGPVSVDSHLINWFEYVATPAAAFDFASISYGLITTDGVVSGDTYFGTGGPTMRNVGNTWLRLQVQQDDMGFGVTMPGSVWNVTYDARVGSVTEYPQGGGANTWYNPSVFKGAGLDASKWTTLPGVIHLCNTWKIDFSIHIVKAILPNYSGTMWLKVISATFTGPNIPHPGL